MQEDRSFEEYCQHPPRIPKNKWIPKANVVKEAKKLCANETNIREDENVNMSTQVPNIEQIEPKQVSKWEIVPFKWNNEEFQAK